MSNEYLDRLLPNHEKIIKQARQHWFILASSIAVEVILIFIIFGLTIAGIIYLREVKMSDRIWLIVLIGFAIMLIPIISMLRDIMLYSNHLFVVSNRRVIQLSGFMNKTVLDSSLEKVNDVKLTQSAFGRLFGYGDIEIYTASERGVDKLKRIKDPISFKTAMLDAKERFEFEARGVAKPVDEVIQQPEMKVSVPELIDQLDQLRQRGVLTNEEFQQKKTELLAKM